MSKAFTKEDEVGDLQELPRLVSPLSPGAKNYLTAEGSRALYGELAHLREARRPPLVAAAPQDGEARQELQAVDQRIAYLQESLRSAEVVPPPAASDDCVRFGATVTIQDLRGVVTAYRIVGVDETNLTRNWVSWQSPIARALLNSRVGQRVPFKFPSGQTELEIMKIEYR